MDMRIDLSGRVAVVTGGSGELGRTMVRTLGRCGADVAVHYHQSAAKAAELVGELVAMGVRGMAVQADVGDLDSVLRMRDAIVGRLGAADIIVNNAFHPLKMWTTVIEQPPVDYDSEYRTCVLHNVFMAKAFVPAMIERGWGRVIAISTEAAVSCPATSSAYVSGKRGMDGVLRALTKEVGPHQISVNEIAPGVTVSEKDGPDGLKNKEALADYERSLPLGRRNTDQDVANAVAFIASDLASSITGAFIPVCSGSVMPGI